MNKTELNMDVINRVIAFKMLDILRENSIIEDNKYASIERKRLQYGESIIKENKLYQTYSEHVSFRPPATPLINF